MATHRTAQPMLAALTESHTPRREDIDAKKQLILRHGLALWDTLESCTITRYLRISTQRDMV